MEERRLICPPPITDENGHILLYLPFENSFNDPIEKHIEVSAEEGNYTFEGGHIGSSISYSNGNKITYQTNSSMYDYFKNQIGKSSPTGDFSIDFWILTTDTHPNTELSIKEPYRGVSINRNIFSVRLSKGSCQFIGSTDSPYINGPFVSQVSDGGWHHLAYQAIEMSPNKFDVDIYLDGTINFRGSDVGITIQNLMGVGDGIDINLQVDMSRIDCLRVMKGIWFYENFDPNAIVYPSVD